MQMSAAVCRNSVCGPGCAEIVVRADGDIAHARPESVVAGGPVAPGIGQTGPYAFGLFRLLSLAGDAGLVHEIIRPTLGAATAVVSRRSISAGRRAGPGPARDRGCYRAGPEALPNSTRHRRPGWRFPPPTARANAPWSSARR